jgi:hypothetical protein
MLSELHEHAQQLRTSLILFSDKLIYIAKFQVFANFPKLVDYSFIQFIFSIVSLVDAQQAFRACRALSMRAACLVRRAFFCCCFWYMYSTCVARELHVDCTCVSRKFHACLRVFQVSLIWVSRPFHVRFTCVSRVFHLCSTWVSRVLHLCFTFFSHVKLF